MFDANKVKLGIAPIGWCNDDMPELGAENTFRQTVSEMALAGFTGCEIGKRKIVGIDLGRACHAVKSLNKSRLCQRGIGAELRLEGARHVAFSVHKLDCIVVLRI